MKHFTLCDHLMCKSPATTLLTANKHTAYTRPNPPCNDYCWQSAKRCELFAQMSRTKGKPPGGRPLPAIHSCSHCQACASSACESSNSKNQYRVNASGTPFTATHAFWKQSNSFTGNWRGQYFPTSRLIATTSCPPK